MEDENGGRRLVGAAGELYALFFSPFRQQTKRASKQHHLFVRIKRLLLVVIVCIVPRCLEDLLREQGGFLKLAKTQKLRIS
jgi:hypothetical protein